MGHRLDEGQRLSRGRRAPLRVLAAALAIVWVGWNAYWIAQGRLPPALLLGLTGLPAPTTGGTRSLLALFEGDWQASLRLNAFAVPIALLCLYCLGRLALQALRRRRLVLPLWIAWTWCAVLSCAWVTKLAVGTA